MSGCTPSRPACGRSNARCLRNVLASPDAAPPGGGTCGISRQWGELSGPAPASLQAVPCSLGPPGAATEGTALCWQMSTWKGAPLVTPDLLGSHLPPAAPLESGVSGINPVADAHVSPAAASESPLAGNASLTARVHSDQGDGVPPERWALEAQPWGAGQRQPGASGGGRFSRSPLHPHCGPQAPADFLSLPDVWPDGAPQCNQHPDSGTAGVSPFQPLPSLTSF